MDSTALKLFLTQQQEAHKEQLVFLQQQQEKLLETILKKIGTQTDHTSILNSLNGRIATFKYNSEDGETFDRWFGRYEDVIKVDGAQLDDASKTRLLVTKLDKHEAEQFRNHILPKMPAEVNFEDTVAMLKKLFNETKSLTRLRYELLSVKFDGNDRKIYTGLVKSRFSVAQWSIMTEDQAQCLLWIMGLQSHEHAELRARALRELEQDSRITLTELTDRLDQVIALRNDADFMGGPASSINAVNYNKAKQHPQSSRKPSQAHSKSNNSCQSPKTPCYKCGQMHWARDCKLSSNTVCRNCNKNGHLAKVCKSKRSTNNAIFIAQSSVQNRNRIYYNVKIEGKQIKMQLDTGAEVTLMNAKDWMRLNKPKLSHSTINLRTANNEPIKVKGQFKCNFNLNGHHGSGLCHVTDTASLLGLDWIAQDTTLYQHLIQASVNSISNAIPEASSECRKKLELGLRSTFPDVFESGLGRCSKAKASLQLKPNASPTFRKARPVPYAVLPMVTQELNRLVKQGVYTATDYSDFATPIVVVDKKDGSIRLCGDYSTGLNDSLDSHQHPLPTAEDIFSTLNGGKYFTQIDLSEAYLQIEVDEDSKKMLTINTHLGLFYPNRLPYGVKSAPAIFQQIVDTMISGLEGVAAYMDDLIICGSTVEEHNRRLHSLFERIKEYGLRVKSSKCSFLQSEVKFLGFIVNRNGRRPDPAKITAIEKMPAPTDVSQLRSFLGLVQFYGSFVKDLHNFRGPLDELTKKDVDFVWTKSCESSFGRIKDVLKSDLLLTHFDPKLPIIVAADASNYGIGAVITHRMADGSEKAIFHASKSLTTAQRGYSQIEKEGLGLIFAVEKFHRYLHGRKFTLRTDHKPLLAIFGSKKGIPVYSSNRLQRWALILLNYDFDIEYINTASFGQADALSRLIATNLANVESEDRVIASVEADLDAEHRGIIKNLPVNATTILKASKADPTITAVIKYVRDGNWPKLEKTSPVYQFFNRRESLSIINDTLMFGHRIVIPKSLRSRVLQTLHQAHLGTDRMKKLARSFVYWPNIDKDIENLVRNCVDCQAAAKNPVKTTLEPWPASSSPFERVHIDYAGPINGIYYLVVVDSFSKWPEILPTKSITATATIALLIPIFARFGNPKTLVSDNGTQFTASEFATFCASRGIRHLRSPPFHPQKLWPKPERLVDTFKTSTSKREKRRDDTRKLCKSFLMSYR
uniref:RNA-directed DNA polymerase n=4 Tax=Caenorhabditis japonica TaxID=281687 RepID=A0A8R1EML3_CAEJA